jgi:predicted nicotinamide N-methyase
VDRGDILPTIRRNLALNADVVRSGFSVAEIDFFSDAWKADLAPDLEKVQVILVADVVYDPDLTRKFFSRCRVHGTPFRPKSILLF